jgi:hypothetical protein
MLPSTFGRLVADTPAPERMDDRLLNVEVKLI